MLQLGITRTCGLQQIDYYDFSFAPLKFVLTVLVPLCSDETDLIIRKFQKCCKSNYIMSFILVITFTRNLDSDFQVKK